MLDRIDVQIINILQKNGRMQKIDIAKKVGLTIPAVTDRIKKMEKSGVIKGYHATINNRAVGKDIIAYVFIFISSSGDRKEFMNKINSLDDIVECHAVTGEGSYLLKIVAGGILFLEKTLTKIRSWEYVRQTRSHIVLSTGKELSPIIPSDSILK